MNNALVVLTGAGISAESGLPTFRDKNGLWAKYNPMELATPDAFARNPELVHEFYNLRRRALDAPNIAPNAAHLALARAEKIFGNFLLITQNVDDLHQRAGNQKLLPMHGQLRRQRCHYCGVSGAASGDLSTAMICGGCGRAGGIRPDIVWFGEMPFFMDEIMAALTAARYFIAIGTSGQVYPAAGFAEIARAAGAYCIECNLEPSNISTLFHEQRVGLASRIVPLVISRIEEREDGSKT